MYVEYNPNPLARRVSDCAVRALAKALGIDWETAYVMLCLNGFQMGDMPSEKSVVSATLRQQGFYREAIPNECPDCYTAKDFCEEHPNGLYVLAFNDHIATVKNGQLFDTFDSSDEVPLFVWHRKDD